MRTTTSTLIRIAIEGDLCFSIIAVLEPGGALRESYRYLVQKLNDGIPFSVLYESAFDESDNGKAKAIQCFDQRQSRPANAN